ncbi:MAG TPA: phosphate ABC transporter substrate-binding protein PstS [Terrimesophilobacter sp.]|nr:phosphate ABC transporter substrate-binding protein PstS [Terrimesophilobacter sp.]
MLSGCAVNESRAPSGSDLSGTISASGASSQQAAQDIWIAGFQNQHHLATVEYDPAGSGAGREMFAAGGTPFAGSDRAFTTTEVAEGEFLSCAPGSGIIELPVYISPIAIVFAVDGIDTLKLDPTTIARIFAGDITRWNDDAITELNPDADLPDGVITAVHRSDDSGVTENFTAYLAATAPDAWPHEPSGVWPLKSGEAAQGTSGVVDAVSNGTGMIGYVDASRASGLGMVDVKVGDAYVAFSSEAAAAIIDASPVGEGRTAGDLAIEIDRASTASGVYPIVLVSYLIGCERYPDAGTAELVRAYFGYVISDTAQREAAEYAGSAPISTGLTERATAAIALIR